MSSFIKTERQLVAEFFSNIGVAWFTAGVIGVFIDQRRNINEIFYSIIWGIFFSSIFLLVGVKLIKR
ncbi:MAG: hypothetical protein US40_C0004G0081 [Candidatus Roizmanbacteria bacterium GW2011_GWC2_37_13]|uniref:Uncharacterized protein n=1 Tax=Candidatus Roizmanbacteria bacterium GW2011_GWC2_37_13 TaxID=1618486 RepID=A0A0G0JCZ6_9BACT|nr:MAG: hypothetical protein US38_C0001G0068 [Candidatus Roizmanbacteria bacterium GW2011_GWC1_37_12]KKQ26046.1 MAG: hypothetical protein US40_C0004G0081 [Candidatus Roizmanbacteria bacterium GW2011_GWC2_37_13]